MTECKNGKEEEERERTGGTELEEAKKGEREPGAYKLKPVKQGRVKENTLSRTDERTRSKGERKRTEEGRKGEREPEEDV